MIDYKQLVLDVVKYMASKHPDVLIELIIKENITAFSGDAKKVASDVVSIMSVEHPDILIEMIQLFAPTVIDQAFAEIKLHKQEK